MDSVTFFLWVGGIGLFLALGFIFPFVVTMHNGGVRSKILSFVIGGVMLWLLWLGGSSIYHTIFDEQQETPQSIANTMSPNSTKAPIVNQDSFKKTK